MLQQTVCFQRGLQAESSLCVSNICLRSLAESSDGRQDALPESQLAYNRFDRLVDAPEV
jgi:hypothetical protein